MLRNLVVALFAILATGSFTSVFLTSPSDAEEKLSDAKKLDFFKKEVKPLLEKNCYRCHGGRKRIKGNLNLTTREGLLKGGDIGPALNVKKPDGSLFLEMLSYKDEEHEMPPAGKLSDEEIAIFTKWIQMGAPYDSKGKVHAEPKEHAEPEFNRFEGADQWWSHLPLTEPALPKVKNEAWIKNGLDHFVLAKLEAEGLNPAPPADPVALIRRVYYNLTGLPPSPEEIAAFVKDHSDEAYDKMIERLLESPQYGERWARHWLDVVRYAETHGYERDSKKPFAWRYRDYVIKAFNEDKSYARFIQEQIAGDELEDSDGDAVMATGFYRLGIWDDEPADRELQKYDILDGIVSTTSSGVLGMSLGCARCHDHKRDPIDQSDYYSFLAFFRNVSNMGRSNLTMVQVPELVKEHERVKNEKDQKEQKIYNEIFSLEQEYLAQAQAKASTGASKGPMLSPIVELDYKFYRDTWDKLPVFDQLRHETEGKIGHNFISVSPASRKEAIGLVYTGKLRVPQDGEYQFKVTAKDGVRLQILDQKILERDSRGLGEVHGKITLNKGAHPFRLEYFNHSGDPILDVAWQGPGMELSPLSIASQYSPPILHDARRHQIHWQFTKKKPEGEWTKPDYKEKDWKRGRSGFGKKGAPGLRLGTPWGQKEIWLRHKFHLNRVPFSILLDIYHDEDVEVYFNGHRVVQLGSYDKQYEVVALGPEATRYLKKGQNTLAVYAKNSNDKQGFDLGIREGSEISNPSELIAKRGKDVFGQANVDKYNKLKAELANVRKINVPNPGVQCMSVTESGRHQTHVLLRGNPQLKGDVVEPAYPSILDKAKVEIPKEKPGSKSSGRRKVLADWLTQDDNPRTSRVMANRIWHHHFGRGIVPTPNDFGRLGEKPTHPKMLDWLAVQFVKKGWSMKKFHRLLLKSATYRMSSKDDEKALAKDPQNALFWRFNMRRLTAEEVRDSLLAINGTLNLKMFGPSIFTEVPQEVLQSASRPGAAWGRSSPEDQRRRSVYIHVKRSLVEPILNTFDVADTDSSCPVRFATTVPTQALTSLNSKFFNDQAHLLAQRLKKEAGDKIEDQIKLGFKLACGREPQQEELDLLVKLNKAFAAEDKLSKDKSLDYLCLIIINLNEFFYLD